MKSRNKRRAWSRRSCPSRSSVRSTSEEIENPISPPKTTAYSVVRLCSPTMWLLNRRAAISVASRTGPALPSPITASRFFMLEPCSEGCPHNRSAHLLDYDTALYRRLREPPGPTTPRRLGVPRLHSRPLSRTDRHRMNRRTRTFLAAASLLAAAATIAFAETVNFGTDWKAEAEHGGFYQAIATGIYQRYGLEVKLRPGGPQVNHAQLLAAGVLDFNIASNSFIPLNFVRENIPMVAVAAIFQKDPSVLIAHPGQGNDSLAGLKGKPIMIGADTRVTSWLFLKEKFGYSDDQIRPYTFSAAPFLADKKAIQQGYLTSEPFTIESTGVKPVVMLLADAGYSSYGALIETSQKLVM